MNHDYMRSLGAEKVVDYHDDGGRLVTISGDVVMSDRGVRMEGIPYQVDVLDEVTQLMADAASGVIHVELERGYPFDEALSALGKVRNRRARGKRVLSLE